MCVYVCVSVYVCVPECVWCPWMPKRVPDALEGVTGSWVLGIEPRSLKEQRELLSAEPSLQPLRWFFLLIFSGYTCGVCTFEGTGIPCHI